MSTKGSARPQRLLLSMEMALTPLPPFPVTHCCTGCSFPSPTLSKKQKQRCNTKSDSGKCVQSFKYLPLLVGPWVQPHWWGAPLHSVPKEGKFCMDPLKHQPLSASSSKEENQSSKQKRFILQQLYRNNLKQLRGGLEKQQLVCVCVWGGENQEVQAL